MSTFTTSRNTRGQHVSPRFESLRYRPSPARREAIHNKVVGLPDRRDPTARLFVMLGLLVALFFALQLMRLI